uniref:Uncharacterized protein n=1 Tax=viral metagenome TaxID=1070528 RepID=A0A6C0J502_9ZZZZ
MLFILFISCLRGKYLPRKQLMKILNQIGGGHIDDTPFKNILYSASDKDDITDVIVNIDNLPENISQFKYIKELGKKTRVMFL